VTGWAHVENLKSDGWLRFDGKSCNSVDDVCRGVSGNGPFVLDNNVLDGQSSMCYNCKKYSKVCVGGEFNGEACNIDSDCGDIGLCNGDVVEVENGGIIMCNTCFTQSLPDMCDKTFDTQCFNDVKYPVGALCTQSDTQKCDECIEYSDGTKTITSCGGCPMCYTHGVAIDYDQNRLVGWAWNSFGNGIGWVHFTPSTAYSIGPWLQTELGNVYAEGDVGSQQTFRAPDNQYNATYQIVTSGQVVNFNTQSGADFVREGVERISFPTIDSGFSNFLGRLDLKGLGVGQYGEVKEINTPVSIEKVLGGKVYVHEGDMVISKSDFGDALVFGTGSVAQPDASGTIIVNGDLLIDTNIQYDASVPLLNIEYLPSVSWIVKGSVIISSDVRELSGSFIVLGDGTACETSAVGSSCGQFITGSSEQSLDVYGLVMARSFILQRFYFNENRGAERFLYDGRASANPPPGLGDAVQSLPEWNSLIPN
jgi:hypothetical protein